MATSTGTIPARRGIWPLRFSLRFLLLSVTVFAIGFAVWYRWPYTETHSLDWEPFPTEDDKIVTTWQRQWGGGRVKHGPQRMYKNGKQTAFRTFRNDVLEGPAEYVDLGGDFLQRGEYRAGKKHGVWVRLDRDGNPVDEEAWNLGIPALAAQKSDEPDSANPTLDKPEPSPPDAQPISLVARLESGAIDEPRVEESLRLTTKFAFRDAPLEMAIEFISADSELPIQIDTVHADRSRKVTCDLQGLQLAAALDRLAESSGHVFDYRYGTLWLTSEESARNWQDPTGTSAIVPAEGTNLATAWSEPVTSSARSKPAADRLTEIAEQRSIAIDMTAVKDHADHKPRTKSTSAFTELPFKHALGLLLYHARCRCEVQGETLVILPSE